MECMPVTKLNDAIQRTYEIKLDGYRAIAVKSGQTINLFSRRGKSFNSQYSYLVEALAQDNRFNRQDKRTGGAPLRSS